MMSDTRDQIVAGGMKSRARLVAGGGGWHETARGRPVIGTIIREGVKGASGEMVSRAKKGRSSRASGRG